MRDSIRSGPDGERGSAEIDRIRTSLRQHLPTYVSRYRVKSLGLFGSYVRGEQGPRSDLDVLIEFEQAPSFFEFLTLEHELEDLLGVTVDLVMKETLKPAIGRHILQEVVPV